MEIVSYLQVKMTNVMVCSTVRCATQVRRYGSYMRRVICQAPPIVLVIFTIVAENDKSGEQWLVCARITTSDDCNREVAVKLTKL
jgi:hypothetical protein